MQSDVVSFSFVKRTDTPAGVARLQHEADNARRLAHPNIVEVVGHRFGLRSGELHFARISGETLARTDVPDGARLAALMSSIASTIAYMHGAGFAHGRLSGDHILIGQDGRPVVCGLRGVTRIASPSDTAAREDVAAIGRLMLGRLKTPVERLRQRIDAEDAHSALQLDATLADLAQHASHTDATKRPLARQLAQQLRELAPQSKPTSTATHGYGKRNHKRNRSNWRSRKSVTKIAALGCVLIAIAGWTWHAKLPARNHAFVARASTLPKLQTCASRPPGTLVTDVDGDGCADTVTIDGASVTVNGERLTAGKPNDMLALGRWNCDGPRTLALLRPSTGNIYVFDAWPGQAGDVEVQPRLVGNVRSATGIAAELQSSGCDRLAITDTSDHTVDIDPRQTSSKQREKVST